MEKIFIIKSKEVKCIINKRAKKNIIFKFENRELHISIPKRFPIKNLQKILEDKSEWVFEKMEYIKRETHNKILFLGDEFETPQDALNYYRDSFNKDMKFENFSDLALEIFRNRVDSIGERINLYPKMLRIKKLKSAWGICYRNQNITLNLLLLCCPLQVIDYVIIHELSHLVHMNHSKEFWKQVELFCPTYKSEKTWLKINGTKIFHQNYL